MCLAIDNSASGQIRAVIRFLQTKKMSAAEIHCKLCTAVYDQNVTSEGSERQRCRMFEDGQTNVHNNERSGRLAICSD
jgi:hypothetical protein